MCIAVRYQIHKILTGDSIQLTNHDHHKYAFTHIFEHVCHHVNNFYYSSHDNLKRYLYSYLMAYNFAKQLKAIKGNTPWQFILNQWTNSPEYLILIIY